MNYPCDTNFKLHSVDVESQSFENFIGNDSYDRKDNDTHEHEINILHTENDSPYIVSETYQAAFKHINGKSS